MGKHDARIIKSVQDQPGISIREIGRKLGLKSHGNLHATITRLTEDGWLTSVQGKSRTIRIANDVFVDSKGVVWKHWEPSVATRNK